MEHVTRSMFTCTHALMTGSTRTLITYGYQCLQTAWYTSVQQWHFPTAMLVSTLLDIVNLICKQTCIHYTHHTCTYTVVVNLIMFLLTLHYFEIKSDVQYISTV